MKKSLNDDLADLNILDERTILEELKNRYVNNKIYTYIGDILISINPLKPLPIYDKNISYGYKICNENLRTKLPPHVFATAEQCYREMLRTQQSQCILISGESGSGKTETCKYIVEHLLNRTKKFESSLNEKIQEVNPLLEAFGNAKTRINDNSSRFGKFLEIYFQDDGSVIGAKFKEYLLEKSRIVYQNDDESTFHIFYHLIGGLLARDQYEFGYKFSQIRHRYIINTVDFKHNNFSILENKKKFDAIRASMVTIGFSDEDIESISRVLISILFIGDISFKNHNYDDGVGILNTIIVEKVCELLEIDTELLSDALISDVQITRGEEIRRVRSMIQACDVRDAFAKALYGRLFSWIVNHINHHIQPADGAVPKYTIGLLDIFGFENFQNNSFEQICINLANEQLHQLFTKYIFKLEIQECLDEQIEMSDSDFISYQDNQIILDLFLDKRNSIFSILDEINRFPQANDESLAIKLHQTLTPYYPNIYRPPKDGGPSFQIKHYAGDVLYNMDGFIEKNRDFLPNNLLSVARCSSNILMQELLQCTLTRKGTIAPSDRQSKLRKWIHKKSDIFDNKIEFISTDNNRSDERMIKHKNQQVKFSSDERNKITSMNNISNEKSLPLTVTSHFKSQTIYLTLTFKNSLHELIEKINLCKPYFIRCIKPNPKQANIFVDAFVIKQLRYCSIMHVCKIRKCGFAYRVKFDEFLKWYESIELCILKKSNELNNVQRCIKCLNYAKITNYKIGRTKIFLRYWHLDILNEISKNLLSKIIVVQKVVRGWLAFRKVVKMRRIRDAILKEASMKMAYNRHNDRSNASSASDENTPDPNEVNSTLEEFDEMLQEFEIDKQNKTNSSYKENKNKPTKLSPSAIRDIVHNTNNKNDNTLKKKNALVAFEFKKIMSEVTNSDLNNQLYEKNKNLSPDSNSRVKSPSMQQLSSSSSRINVNANNKNHRNPKDNHGSKNENTDQSSNQQSITIWREELNLKANREYKLKKEIEFVQKIEDSKIQIPEWKRNLIKNKEIKKSSNGIGNISHNGNTGITHFNSFTNINKEETSELLKHNIFRKKGLATNS